MTLPTDRPAGPAQTAEGDLSRATIPRPTVDRLDEIARGEGASRFMTVAALLGVLLARCTGQRDLLFGSTVAQRQQPELRHLIGLFTNAFPFRADLSGNPTFRQLLARTRRDLIADYEGSALPFGLLVDALRTERSGTRMPLIRVHIQLEKSHGESTAYQELQVYDGSSPMHSSTTLTAAHDVIRRSRPHPAEATLKTLGVGRGRRGRGSGARSGRGIPRSRRRAATMACHVPCPERMPPSTTATAAVWRTWTARS